MIAKIVELGSVCRIIGGGTPSKNNPNFYTGTIPWATVRDMGNDYLEKTELSITEDAVRNSSTNVIPKGNVVIVTRVGLGKASILNQDTAINQDLRGLIPLDKTQLNVKYLFYWFKSVSQIVIDAGRGATVHGVTLPFIRSLKIPLPDLYTQENIVKSMEEIFLEIDNASRITNEKLKALIQLKKSYLHNSFEIDE